LSSKYTRGGSTRVGGGLASTIASGRPLGQPHGAELWGAPTYRVNGKPACWGQDSGGGHSLRGRPLDRQWRATGFDVLPGTLEYAEKVRPQFLPLRQSSWPLRFPIGQYPQNTQQNGTFWESGPYWRSPSWAVFATRD
jgi:hypothetical protein